MNWNLFGLACKDFILNHVNKIFISCFRFTKILDKSSPQSQMVLSSAKLQISLFSINTKILFIKTLNKRGPKVDPWGTSLLISFHKLYNEPNFTLCLLDVN